MGTSSRGAPLEDPARLGVLAALGVRPGERLPSLDRLAGLARRLLHSESAFVTLVLPDRQLLPGADGADEGLQQARETSVDRSLCQYVVADQRPVVLADARGDARLRDNPAVRDGLVAYAGFPLRAPDGSVLGSFCVTESTPRDWTADELALLADLASAAESEVALRLTYQAVDAARARIQRVLDGAYDAFVSLDAQGRVVAWNAAAERLFGWSAPEAHGRLAAELLVPERFRQSHQQALQRLGARPGRSPGRSPGRRMEVPALHRSGDEVPVSVSVQVDLDETGAVRFHAFVRDMSEQRELERLKDEFIAMVAHELRNPVAAIRGFADLGRQQPGLPPVAQRALDVIDRRSRQLQDLVDDLFEHARLDAGMVPLDCRPLRLDQLVEETVADAHPAAREAGLTLTLTTSGDPEVDADAGRLRQVLDNLLSNAVKYTPAGGSVEVRVRIDDGLAVVEVADTGIGVAPGEHQRLFERLYRGSTAKSHGITGTGLGLSMAKSLVEAHGGTIGAAPRSGGGTVFSVRLPRR